MDYRFFHRLGATLLDRTICTAAADEGYRYSLGERIGVDVETFPDARLIICWGDWSGVGEVASPSAVAKSQRCCLSQSLSPVGSKGSIEQPSLGSIRPSLCVFPAQHADVIAEAALARCFVWINVFPAARRSAKTNAFRRSKSKSRVRPTRDTASPAIKADRQVERESVPSRIDKVQLDGAQRWLSRF